MRVCLLSALAVLAACQTTEASGAAVLTSADENVMIDVKAVLATALNKASVEIGPGDLTKTSVITVLPPPLGPNETRSPAKPIRFDIVKDGEVCFVVRKDTGEAFALENVSCKPVEL